MSCIGWVQASEVWALRMPFFHMCPKSAYHSLVRRGLEVCLHSLPSVFLLFMWATFWFTVPLRGWAFIVTGLYISWLPLFPTMSLYHFCCNDSILLGFFRPTVYSFPSGLTWPTVSSLWAPVSLLFFSWASLAHLLFLGFLIPFTNFAPPWAFTNFVGLHWPNYLILILGVHRLAINPLLSLFALLWVCNDPFSLFYIIYCSWVCYFSLSRLL